MPIKLLFLLSALLWLSACSSTGDADDPTFGLSAAEIYEEAKGKLENEEYESAIQFYERLESRYPYGPYALRAQLDIIYAYYKYGEAETSILSAERFIKLHPNHPNVDYAYYLRGLAAFKVDPTFLDRWFDQDMTERDPQSARRAFQYLSELVKRFPNSRYAFDAVARMYQLRDGLANYEIHVARYYSNKGAYVAAVNRAKFVVENYQGTPAMPEALAIMVTGYRKLGLTELATDALKVLKLNHTNHAALKKLEG